MGSVSQEGNVGNVNNRGAGDSIEVSPGDDGLEVGDMVWGKVKSHPWWPGYVYSEELATSSVLRSKRDGQLLVAFFGDSSYGWFDPLELIPFDSNFSEKSQQTNSRTFVKALEEATDEVRRRSSLGLSCMCRNKQNFRQTDAQSFYAVDVVGHEPEAVYSIDTIVKARVRFQPWLVLDFVRELALESTDEHDDTVFIKNMATVMSYRRAVYEEIDETYDQALGGDLVRPLPVNVQVSTPRKKPAKAPLSGQQVFGDTIGKLTELNKPKDHHAIANKDNHLFRTKTLKVKDSTHIEDPVIATLKGSASTVEEDKNLDFEINTPIRSLIHTQIDIPSSRVKPLKRLAGKLGSGKSASPEKKKKRKEESLFSEDTNGKDLMEKVSAVEVAGDRSSGKSVLPENKKKRKKEALMAADGEPPQPELPWILESLHSFALDPFHTNNNRKLRLKLRQVFLKFRSLAFRKGLNSVTKNEANSKSPVTGAPPVKPPPVRPDDPTKGGIKLEEIHAKKKKKITELKIPKKLDENGGRGRQAAVVKPGQQRRAVEPTVLKMEFPSGGSLPSINELKAKLRHYGALDHDGTRVYWKTFTCLVVYKYKADALAALAAAGGGCNLFGNTDVKYSLKQVSESQPPPKVTHHPPAVVVEDRVAMAVAALKSCLKNSGGEEGGARKTSHVKFSFIGGESRNSKSLKKGILHLPISTGVSTPPPPPRNSMHYRAPTLPPRSKPPPPRAPLQLPPRLARPAAMPPPPNIDIAQQMVSLLTRCNDVVAHIKGILGYVPCHPL